MLTTFVRDGQPFDIYSTILAPYKLVVAGCVAPHSLGGTYTLNLPKKSLFSLSLLQCLERSSMIGRGLDRSISGNLFPGKVFFFPGVEQKVALYYSGLPSLMTFVPVLCRRVGVALPLFSRHRRLLSHSYGGG